MLRGVERLIRDCATSTPAMFPPRVGSIGSCVHRCRVDACATGGQRCAPALATEVAAVPGGLDREAFSGCSGEMYQSDRTSDVKGKSVSVRVDLGGRRIIIKKRIKIPPIYSS